MGKHTEGGAWTMAIETFVGLLVVASWIALLWLAVFIAKHLTIGILIGIVACVGLLKFARALGQHIIGD